jgi:lipopolysaccharide transport system ATP-binding protein
MTVPIIEIKSVSKRYSITSARASEYKRLSESIANIFTHPFKTVKGMKTKKETFLALNDVSFTVDRGQAIGIIGRNGAGKSTLLKILSRVTYPTEGEVILRGRVGSLLEVGTGFHPELSGRENIYLNGAILGMKRKEIDHNFDDIVKFAEIEQFLDTPVKRYSSGMYVRLAFAVAAHLQPEILLVDEVLAVGDAQFQKKCLGKMKDVSEGGRTVLFVSHNMKMIEALCEKAYLLDAGKLVKEGPASEITKAYSELGGAKGEIYHVLTPELKWLGVSNRDSLENLTPDEDIELVLSFEAGGRPINGLYVDCELWNEKDQMIIHAKAKLVSQGFNVDSRERFDIVYRIVSPKLAPGRYYMTVYCNSGGFPMFWAEKVDACHIVGKAYFGDALFFDGFKSAIIPEYSVAISRQAGKR